MAAFARLGDEITIIVPPMHKGLLFWQMPRQTTALISQGSANTGHAVRPSPSLSKTLLDSSAFVCGLHFSVMLLFLDKRDEGSFSDLISQWELFALEATYTNVN